MTHKKLTDFIGTIAVVLGLVFVGFEIRQNTDAVRSSTLQALAEMSMENVALGVENSALREAYTVAMESPDALTAEQAAHMRWFTVHAMRVMENRFRQFELGVLDDATAVGGTGRLYRSYWFRTWWERNEDEWAGSAFHDFIVSEVLPNSATQPPRVPDSDEPDS